MSKFAIIGLGFISDRHIAAINNTGNELTLACDIDEEKKYKAGNAKFFKYWDEMLESPEFSEVDYLVICTPNNLHYAMAKAGLDKGKKVICEKPPVIDEEKFNDLLNHPNIDNLSIVLQCRYAPKVREIKETAGLKKDIEMIIEVYRDEWYMNSWKNDPVQSGGLLYNIGCHYFDLLAWWFGGVKSSKLEVDTPRRCEGTIEFETAKVKWVVAIDATIDKQKRILTIDNDVINLTQLGFEGLHTEVYKNVLLGNGYKLSQFKETLKLIENLYGTRTNGGR